MIYVVYNQKGGTGKTTLTYHLTIGAAMRGLRPVALDADPQGNLTTWLLGALDDSVYRLLMTPGDPKAAANQAIRAIAAHKVGLIGGGPTTAKATQMLASVGSLPDITARIRAVGTLCDLLIIDMPPTQIPGYREILRAADGLIIPTQLERHSIEGVALVAETITDLKRTGPAPRLLGIVPNHADIRTSLHRLTMNTLMQQYGKSVLPAIPKSVKVAEVVSVGSSLFAEYPYEKVTAKMTAVLNRMLEATGHGTKEPSRTPANSR